MKKHPFTTESICQDFSKIFNRHFIFLLLLVFSAGCKKVKEDTGVIGLCPEVLSTSPGNGVLAVSMNMAITAEFNEVMDSSSISTTTFLIKDGTTPVSGNVTYSGVTATFTPSGNLTPNTIYTGTITTGVRDRANTALPENYVWSFTTGKEKIPPTVVSTDPSPNATGVAINKQVTATFSEPMEELSAIASFIIKEGTNTVLGTVTYAGTTVTFSPTGGLLTNTTYTATITTGSKDTSGNALANDYTWNFSTPQPVVLPPAIGALIETFGAFGGSAGMTNQGLNTVINNGNIATTGVSTLVTGFHDATTGFIYTETPLNVGNVTGRIYTAPPPPGDAISFTVATDALIEANALYNSISPASRPGGMDPGAGELGGLTLAPGIYKSASGTFNISNLDLTLDGMGDPNAVWIFQTAAGLTVGIAGPIGARSIIMKNGASPENVFWHVGSAAVINGAGGGVMAGTIIAQSGVTFSTAGNVVQTVLNGRAISLVSSVTMVNTTINVPN